MEAILLSAEPFEIHGTPYYVVTFAPVEDRDKVTQGRVAAEGIYKDPQPGDHIRVRMILGVIDDISHIDS